jgi:two-component system, chemotaxis family, protein-glutamate methylesterase/glutaminase
MTKRRVALLLADDSPLVLQILLRACEDDPEIEVVGTAENGEVAIALTKARRPNVIVMDANMPTMDGLRATERIMKECPTPILVITADAGQSSVESTRRALSAGALALRLKPSLSSEAGLRDLFAEVKLLATIKVVRHLRGPKEPTLAEETTPSHSALLQSVSKARCVGIVSSTGGPAVLQRLFQRLPKTFPLPVVVLQHINQEFAKAFVDWLSQSSSLSIRMARAGDTIQSGTVLCCPPDVHLRVSASGTIVLSKSEPIDGHRPSGTVLLRSLADSMGNGAVGVLLSGMGSDGAQGLADIYRKGGMTVAQNAASSVVHGMPGAAIRLGVVRHIVDAEALPSFLSALD